MGRILHGPSAVQSMLRVRSSTILVRFQKLNFIVHVSLIVCAIRFRVILDILVWVSSVVPLVRHRCANRRTSATADDVPVAISKTIANFDNFTPQLSVFLYLYCAMDAVLRMGKWILWENSTCAVYSDGHAWVSTPGSQCEKKEASFADSAVESLKQFYILDAITF